MRRTVNESDKGKRFDQLALELLPSLSRAYVQKLIEEGRISVNRGVFKPGYRLRIGDKIATDFDLAELEQIESINLPILFENKDVIVIDKSAGVLSHARGRFRDERGYDLCQKPNRLILVATSIFGAAG
jgi:23S rRNA pseudouridine1911/1915/1917 synthase